MLLWLTQDAGVLAVDNIRRYPRQINDRRGCVSAPCTKYPSCHSAGCGCSSSGTGGKAVRLQPSCYQWCSDETAAAAATPTLMTQEACPPVWAGVATGSLTFALLNLATAALVPASASSSAQQRWKWRNVATSLVHSVITGSWALAAFYQVLELGTGCSRLEAA